MSPAKCLAIVLLLVFGVYARSIFNDFTYDDRHYVMAPADGGFPNTMVAEWQGVGAYYTAHYGKESTSPARNLRPTTVMSFALVHQISDGPALQHFVNIGLHLLATWLIYLLLLRFFCDTWPAIGGAAVFGLHALRSDPVISIVGRGEILSLVFGVLGLLMFLAAMKRTGKHRLYFLCCVGVSIFLSYGAKESGLAWAAFIPLFALACHWRNVDPAASICGILRPCMLPWALAVLLPAIFFGWLLYLCIQNVDMYILTVNNPIVREDAVVRISTAVMVLGYGLLQVLFPFWLCADYSYRTFELVESFGDLRFLIPALIFLFGIAAGLRYAHKQPALFIAVALFFGFSFASSNIAVPVGSIYGERFMYTPGVALCFIVAWAFSWIRRSKLDRKWRLGLTAFAGAWLGMSCLVIVVRCGVWADDMTLFEHEAQSQSQSIRMQLSTGKQYNKAAEKVGLHTPEGAQLRQRWKHYIDRALVIDSENPFTLISLTYYYARVAEVMRMRGSEAEALQEESKAEEALQRALRSPGYEDFYGERIYPELARLADLRGDVAARLRYCKKALEIKPDSSRSYLDLGLSHVESGDQKAALEIFQRGLQRYPDLYTLRYAALEAASRSRDSRAFQALLQDGESMYKNSAMLSVYRAILHVQHRQFAQAISLFDAAIPALQGAKQRLPVESLYAYPLSLLESRQAERAKQFLNKHLDDDRLTASERHKMLQLAQRVR